VCLGYAPKADSSIWKAQVNLFQDLAIHGLVLPISFNFGMARHPKHNVVEARTSGYITREKLETFLKAKFKVSSLTEFDIKVCPATIRTRAYEAEIK
jgi:hypothetical protein